MSDNGFDLGSALVEVRRAYRLLHAYHRRLCDLLQVVDEHLVKKGITFEHWAPLNVCRLPKSNKPFFSGDKWAWDLTPGYQVECVWVGTANGTTYKIHIHSIADTGYDDSGEGEPDPSRFKHVEQTTSELRIGLYRTRAKQPDWSAAWEQFSRKRERKNGKDHQVTVGGNEYVHRYFAVDLAELGDEHAVTEKLVRPLGQWLSES